MRCACSLAVPAAVVFGALAAPDALAQVERGGYYRGALAGGGRIVLVVSDDGRSINRGVNLTGVRVPCGDGVTMILFNLFLDQRAIRIRGRSFRYVERSAGMSTGIRGRFRRGGRVSGRVSVDPAGPCRGSIGFTARA